MLDITPFIWLLLVATIVAMLVRRFKLPYAIALVITGLAIGAPHLVPHAHLEPHTLFTVFLPPLLFEAAIQLRLEALGQRWRTIALLALVGTVISAVVTGGLVAWVVGLPLLPALVFGVLTAPTDPISVIALFKRLGVGKQLTLIVETESLLNDGVAVVLFGVLSSAAMGGAVSVPSGLLQFATVMLGGAGIGAAIGWVASRVTHAFDDHLLEIMLTTVVAFGSYLGAEAAHVSGVMAVVVAGLFVGNYGMRSGMSPTTRLAVMSFWEYAAFAANSLVFLLIGIEVTVLNLWSGGLGVLAAALIVLCGRAVAVYVLSPVAGVWEPKLPRAWQHVMFWGGLRGALSMALTLGLPQNFPERHILVVLTFGVVLFSLLVQGLTVAPLLQRLGIGGGQRSAAFQRTTAVRLACLGGLEELRRRREQGMLTRAEEAALRQEYEARLHAAEAEAEQLREGDPELERRRSHAIRRLALQGEKAALLEASGHGLVDSEAARPVLEQIDQQLLELQAAVDEH